MTTPDDVIADIDAFVYSDAALPLRGWHDDYRGLDRTPEYRPALQQVKQEFRDLVTAVLNRRRYPTDGASTCVQLGLGGYGAAHVAFRQFFDVVVSVDMSSYHSDHLKKVFPTSDYADRFIVGDTHSPSVVAAVNRAAPNGCCDLLFIDAGHKFHDVALDFTDYGKMVRPGGIIAMHDAAKRPGYEEEIEVWKWVDQLRNSGYRLMTLGTEVGITLVF